MHRFRLMTANLFTRWVDPDHVAAVIDEHRPDVLVAQELAPRAAEVIAGRFPHHVLSPDNAYSGWGMASRLPAVIEEGRPGWGRGGHGLIEVGQTVVHVATVHILDPMKLPPWRTAWRRREQVEALFSWGDALPDGEPQLVAGDLNASPMWPVYRRLTSRWTDLVEQAAGAVGSRAPRTWGLPGGPRLLRIDHVLGTNLTPTNPMVIPIKGSDHSAVLLDLEVDRANLR